MKMHRYKTLYGLATFLLVLTLLAGAAPAAAQSDSSFTLTILHTNDTHAHIEQYDGSTTSCSASKMQPVSASVV